VHAPADEQKVNTPLPVYVESPAGSLSRVVVKYAGTGVKTWSRLEMKRIGAGWGAYAMGRPALCREIGAALERLIGRGYVSPLVGARFPLERAAEALRCIDGRHATGKVVLDVREG